MAKVIPGIEKAKLSKQPSTEGELFLLNYLEEYFHPDAEVYFQSCFNGERPDVVIIKKGVGAIIVEVKDWSLASYNVDIKNQWRLAKNNALLKSPFAQAFSYKKNLFEVHTNGLLDKSMASETFYGLIKVYVYFHNATKSEFSAFYEPALCELRDELDAIQKSYREQKVGYEPYEKKRLYLATKKKQLERDLGSIAVTRDSLKKSMNALSMRRKGQTSFPVLGAGNACLKVSDITRILRCCVCLLLFRSGFSQKNILLMGMSLISRPLFCQGLESAP